MKGEEREETNPTLPHHSRESCGGVKRMEGTCSLQTRGYMLGLGETTVIVPSGAHACIYGSLTRLPLP